MNKNFLSSLFLWEHPAAYFFVTARIFWIKGGIHEHVKELRTPEDTVSTSLSHEL
jgi:hypothetical protein